MELQNSHALLCEGDQQILSPKATIKLDETYKSNYSVTQPKAYNSQQILHAWNTGEL